MKSFAEVVNSMLINIAGLWKCRKNARRQMVAICFGICLVFTACGGESAPAARDTPRKPRGPQMEETVIDPIDPRRLADAMKVVIVPDPPAKPPMEEHEHDEDDAIEDGKEMTGSDDKDLTIGSMDAKKNPVPERKGKP